MPHKQNPRTVLLPCGRGLMLHRLSSSVMGIIGHLDTVGSMDCMTHYRFYTLDAGRITRKLREARR